MPVIQVEVDVKPGTDRNPINPGARGRVPVAFLGSEEFDVSTVDVATVRMGGDDGASSERAGLEDTNGDGLTDLVLHFPVRDTGIVCGDDVVIFAGLTDSGDDISGVGEIETVSCARKK